MTFALFFGIVPPILLLYYIWTLDKVEQEPIGLVLKTFFFGMLSVIPAVVLEIFGGGLLIFIGVPYDTWLYYALDCFLVVAFAEEFSKRMMARFSIWNNPEFNYRFDAVLYLTASALGFAAAENIMYLIDSDLGGVLGRLIPVHTICGVFMGYYLGFAKTAELDGDREALKKWNRLSLLVPMLIHGFYDFTLSTGSMAMVLVSLLMVVVLTFRAYRSIRKVAAEDRPL